MDGIAQGWMLLLIGMATVFAFLALLVAAMNLSAAFFRKFGYLFPEPEKPENHLEVAKEDRSEIAVVLAAVRSHTGN